MSEWRPIETAPVDVDCFGKGWSRPLLLLIKDEYDSRNIMVVCQKDSGQWMVHFGGLNPYPLQSEPSHWMPLPEPPQ